MPTDVTLAASFSDFPAPDTIDAGNVLLYTGFFYHTGRFWVDLVDRRALFKPSSALRPGLGYTFVVKPAIRSLRGCDLEPPARDATGATPAAAYAFRFQTVPAGADHPPVPVPASRTTFQQVMGVFGDHCAGSACHLTRETDQIAAAPPSLLLSSSPSPPSPPSLATMASQRCLAAPGGGLSLCERDARAALLGVPSRQVNPLVLVASRDSSRSYLLRKIVGAPPLVGHSGVPGDTLSQDDKHIIQDWIDNGASGASSSSSPLSSP